MKPESLVTADENRKMFDAIAWRYDLMNKIVSLGMDRSWRQKAVDCLRLQSRGRYLDVGIGTGDLSLEILSRQSDAEVVGIDHSPTMLDIARHKFEKVVSYKAISLREGDALELPYEDSSFDGVISGFCLRNLEDRVRGLAEMRRVTESEGKVVVLELSTPCDWLIKPLHFGYSRTFVPLVARLLSYGSAYNYLVKSIKDFPHPDEVLEMMDKAGFSKMTYIPLSRGIVSLFVGTI